MADDLDDEWWLEDKDVEDTGKFCLVHHSAFFSERKPIALEPRPSFS